MKTILLLGGYGFLGTNILKYIDSNLSDSYQVIIFDYYITHPAGVDFNCVFKTYNGNFADDRIMDQIFQENHIDIVFHCISTTIPSVASNAKFDIESNLIPTVCLLDSMVKNKVNDIVYISSGGAIYGNESERCHKESDDVFPISSYGIVKLSIEKYLMQYSSLYGIKPLILRLSNPYGLWHYSMKQGVCNIAINNAITGSEFKVWGDGTGRKDYIFVRDFVDILFRLVHKGICNDVINVGSNLLISVNDILEKIKIIVPSFKWYHIDASQYDVPQFKLDTSKLHNIIGGYKFTSIEDGLILTYRWTKDNVEA